MDKSRSLRLVPLTKKLPPPPPRQQTLGEGRTWHLIALLVEQVCRGNHDQAEGAALTLALHLDANGPPEQREILLAAVARAQTAQAEERQRTYVCTINIDAPSCEQYYGHWAAHMADGAVCAGCGGYNDYGYGGYMGAVCYQCHTEERRQLQAQAVAHHPPT